MITTIVTFLTEKIVAVIITTVVVVAAVPTLIVAIHGNTITITTGPVASASRTHSDDEFFRLVKSISTRLANEQMRFCLFRRRFRQGSHDVSIQNVFGKVVFPVDLDDDPLAVWEQEQKVHALARKR